ncbi:MAG: putative pre-peptidase [Planctomycetaceae bacterium]|nr:putative pre-peptidase [Planctomycetaceae bacterium]
MRNLCLVLIVWAVTSNSIQAAAPKLDLLYPAGGARGATVTVTLSGTFDPWPVQVWSSRPELQIKPLDEKGKLSITIPAECPVGRGWIRVFNAEGASVVRPFVVGALPEIEEVEPNNELAKAQVVPGISAVVNGKHQANNDVDVYSMTLKAGQTLIADLDASQSLGSPADPVLQILSPQGFVLDQNDDDQGLDPRLIFTAPSDGQYLIRTFAFPAATNSSIHFSGGANWIYRLTLTTGGFVDHVLPLVLSRSTASEVQIFGTNLGPDPVKVPVAGLDGERLLISGPQFGNPISANLVAFPVLVELEPNAIAQPQVVPVPIGISGVISASDDIDAFRFSAKKGQSLQIKVLARKLGSPIDPVVTLTDLTGKQLQRLDDQGENRDPDLTWNPPADGDYLLRVSDLHDRGGPRFFYYLSISPPQPDFHLTVATDNFVIPVDKPLEIPVTIERQAGFKSELEISVQGLPEGVTAAPVKSAADGDTAKSVKLIVTGNATAFSGPIRISATTTADPKINRIAQFPLTEYHSDFDQLWLTVIKK